MILCSGYEAYSWHCQAFCCSSYIYHVPITLAGIVRSRFWWIWRWIPYCRGILEHRTHESDVRVGFHLLVESPEVPAQKSNISGSLDHRLIFIILPWHVLAEQIITGSTCLWRWFTVMGGFCCCCALCKVQCGTFRWIELHLPVMFPSFKWL